MLHVFFLSHIISYSPDFFRLMTAYWLFFPFSFVILNPKVLLLWEQKDRVGLKPFSKPPAAPVQIMNTTIAILRGPLLAQTGAKL